MADTLQSQTPLVRCGNAHITFPVVREAHFLGDIVRTALPDFPAITLFQLGYSPEVYHPTLFSTLDIPFPAHLQRAVDKRQAEYLASRYLVRQALSHYGIEGYILSNDAQRAPIWPAGIVGSLSHTRHCVSLLLASADCALLPGVDCEEVMQSKTAQELASTIVNEEERQQLEQSGLPFATALTAAFSLKESLYKALFPSLRQFMHFSDAEIISCSPQAERVTLRLLKDFSPRFPAGCEFSGHTLSDARHLLSWVIVEGAHDATQAP
ncbi:4'-phosphopantetheinyl transferase [Erwinia sp. ErVv1]|uniref:4'-phosphopantetheinyl transferase family protein n=1 Tax=Erwinia sp. ErVv1 TaxID=1603299 RepID=UPI000AC7B3B0|nr:4'-phosphopantetheinyl transferase superfamily protein [Erwinia sp. ErVv1]